MTDTTSIPLNKLVLWSGNVRKTAGSDTGLAELAASIAAHGLINPLTVRPGKGNMFEVGAGGRRLSALKISGHKTDSMERRYNIVDSEDLQMAKELLQNRRRTPENTSENVTNNVTTAGKTTIPEDTGATEK